MATEFPTGTVTLLFTDIEGSSDLWQRFTTGFKPALDAHNRLLREAAARWGGFEVKTEGDSFFLAFGSATAAVRFAVDAQLACAAHDWPSLIPGLEALRVRIGLHSGEPVVAEHPDGPVDYFGPAVNRAARIAEAAHGGQILLSDASRTLSEEDLPPEISLQDLGTQRLRGAGDERLWQVRHPELPATFPPLRTLNPLRHNLPPPATPFVGREAELSEWFGVLREPATRLVSLVGFGGMGKTRAALQLGEMAAEHFPDGVWWVELEDALNGEGMIQRIASSLHVQLQPRPSLKEQVFSFLRERELLLILDNTEQIPDAARVLGELLAAAPRLRCLVTSRKPLELQAEKRLNIRPLPAADAERLFEERARARKPEFAVTAENRADVAELCRRLEGVPLAIELAASRIAALSPRDILGRLTEQFRLLQTRSPDLPPRQRALRGTIDWSYELLSDEDRVLLAQISVFSGGCTLADAEAVCEVFDVFEGVLELHRHSLLTAETDPATQQTRYHMLQSVQQYGAEKLEELGEAYGELRARHARHYLDFAEARVARIRTHREAQALDDLGREYENLCEAADWTESAGEAELGARLCLSLYELLYRRGFWAEALRRLQRALSASGEMAPELRAAILQRLGSIALDTGSYETAEAHVQESLRLNREIGAAAGEAEALSLLGLISMRRKELEPAERYFHQALRILPQRDAARRGIVTHNLALAAYEQGDRESARRLYQEALEYRREARDSRGEAETLANLGALAHDAGELDEARRLYHASLPIFHRVRDRFWTAVMLNNLGELSEETDPEQAVLLLVHAGRLFRELQSDYAGFPDTTLRRIGERIGEDRLAGFREAAETRDWEPVLGLGAP